MAGHSKWANIRIRKGKQDALRSKMFTKLSREIIVAARLGGGDPDQNARLRLAIEKAKQGSMPKDNIERAIAKGSGDAEGEDYEELTYEGRGPAGSAFVVECYSENRNRTVADLRHAFSRHGGSLGENGSVSWQFKHCGVISISGGPDEEELTMAALEAGADDVRKEEEAYVVETAVESLHACSDALREAGYEIEGASLAYVPTVMAEADVADQRKVIRLAESLEDLDDVKETFFNVELSEGAMAED